MGDGAGLNVQRASTNVHRGGVERVEKLDRVFAAVAGEVAVVAVDHAQARAHAAGELEGGDAALLVARSKSLRVKDFRDIVNFRP
jgi:hypothetical protein